MHLEFPSLDTSAITSTSDGRVHVPAACRCRTAPTNEESGDFFREGKTMSGESIGSGVAQGVASNLVTAALTTPQGQVVVAETVALAVAAAPVAVVVAGTAGVLYVAAKIADLLNL